MRQVHLPFGELQENFQITDPLVTSLWKDTLDFRWKMSFRCFPGIRNVTHACSPLLLRISQQLLPILWAYGWEKNLIHQRYPMKSYCVFQLLLRFFALPNSSLAPPRNPPGELFIAQPVADIFQPRVCALPFQIGERFL